MSQQAPDNRSSSAFLEGHGPSAASGLEGARKQQRLGRIRNAREWVVVVSSALALALVLRAFVLGSFYIPSGSMIPTLGIKDRVLVNKLSYRKLGPIGHDVNRGDVVVFARPPGAPSNDGIKDLIKRVIGLPGDVVEFSEGRVIINGRLLEEPYLAETVQTFPKSLGPKIEVGEGQVLVLGDNREDSRDGRYFGPIDTSLIVGRAMVRFWPYDHLGWL